MRCYKCKKEVKKTKTKYGYSWECPCGHICIQATKNITPLTFDNNLK